jgi:hypothetical protein
VATWHDVIEEADWQAQLRAAPVPAALQQSWAYGEAVRAQAHEVRRLLCVAGGEPRAIAQLTRRRLFGSLDVALLLRGPVWLDAANDPALERQAIASLGHQLRRCLIVWQPDDADAKPRRADCQRVWTGSSTAWLDLRPPLTALRRGLDGKWRNMLKRAEAEALELRAGTSGPLIDWLISANERHRREIGYRGPAPAFIATLARAGSEPPLVLIARHAAVPVAGVLFIRHGRAATYFAGVTSAEGRALRAHHLLLWEAVRRLKDAGCTSLDLGGIDTVTNPGIARFKLGLGGAPLTLAGSYLLPWRWR